MKKLFQAVDIKKWAKKITASAVIVSMFMIDAARAMEDDHDPHFSKALQRTPSQKPRATDLEIIDSDSSKQSSSSEDSGSSPEKLTPEGNQNLPIISFPGFSLSHSQDVASTISPSIALLTSSLQPLEIVPQPDFGTTPITAGSLQDRVPSPQAFSGPRETSSSSQDANSPSKSRLNVEDPLLDSDSSSFSSSDSSSDEPFPFADPSHLESEKLPSSGGFPNILALFTGKKLTNAQRFTSTQPRGYEGSGDQPTTLLPGRWRSTPTTVISGTPLLRASHSSIQSPVSIFPGSQELSVNGDVEIVVDDGSANLGSTGPALPQLDENPASRLASLWERPIWPERSQYILAPGALERASQFLIRFRAAHHSSNDDSDRSTSFESDSPPQGSPTFLRHGPFPDLDHEGEEDVGAQLLPTAQPLLPAAQSYGALRTYLNFAEMPSSSQALSSFPRHDQGLDSTAAAVSPSQPLSPQAAWLELLDGLKDLPATTKTQLTDFTHQILNGKSTWAQRIGKWLIGPLIGVGFAWAMGPVYDGGLMYLANISEGFSSKFLRTNASNYLVLYINYSAGPDGISRNAHLWKKGIAYLSQEKKEVGRMCIAGAIAAVTALIPVAYLILAENIPREEQQLPNWDNGFGIIVAAFGPVLYIDAFAKELEIARKTITNLEDWFRQARELFFPSSLPYQMKPFDAIQREKFDHDLIKLKHFLAGASNTVIEAIYKDVQDVIAGARSEVDLKAQQAFAAVSYLLSLGDEIQEVAKKNAKKSIAEIAFDGLKYTCLILGAPSVGLLLQLVGSTVASLFTSNVVADSIGEGFALVAFLPFNYVLVQSMDNFKNLLMSKDPQGYESHPAVRLPVKVFIGIQSFIYLFQTSVAVLQSYQKWFGDQWWPFAAGIPFFIPKLMGLATSFNETFNEQVTTAAINGSHRIGGKCRGDSLCPPCQKDWLVRLVESSRNDLEHWDPKLIHDLSKGVEIFKNEEANSSFDEI
ncbi:MAG: hypothetical protein MRY83_05685 [Flavobacteriales bacterium]|nr:hypothetical protein [Flavobacteriales bacterium]